MKSYPRALNRVILAIFGILLIALGAGVLTVSLWPKAAKWWQVNSQAFLTNYQEASEKYVLVGGIELFPVLWISGGILLSLIALVIIFNQGGGRRVRLLREKSKVAAGSTDIDVTMLEPLLQAMAKKNRWIAQCSVDAWKVKGQPAVLITLQCYKGASAAKIKRFATKMVGRVDTILDKELPVQVRLTSGWQTTFSSPERVR